MADNNNNNNVLRAVDDDSRRQAKTLVRQARYASLACLEPATGCPLVSQVNVATDTDGAPVLLISKLSAHFAALEQDPRCALLLGVPGKGDPAAHPRITVVGHAARIDSEDQRRHVRRRFLARHPKSELYADFGDFAFWRVAPTGASLNGGFGKAYEMAAEDITCRLDQCPGMREAEAEAIAHMNGDHADAVALYATVLLGEPAGPWRLANLDPEGLDLVQGDRSARLWFDHPLTNSAGLRTILVQLANKARRSDGCG